MADKKISQLTLKTGNMAASDLVEITEGGNTTKSVNGTKIINMVTGGSVVTANTAKTGITSSQANAITANTAKTGITSSQANAITANTSKVTNATHSGEVTGATALTIADNVVDEANLKVSNTPTNGYFLSAQSGNTGGLTWAAASGGGGGSMTHISTTTISGTSTSQVVITGMDNTYKTYQLYAYWLSNAGNTATDIQLTDGGTKITSAVYNGARQFNGSGGTLNGRTNMYILGAEISLTQLAEIYTFSMDGNNIQMVNRSQAAFNSLGDSSPQVFIAQSCHALSSSYSASGNIDGISFTGGGGNALGNGSRFILYGLAE